MSLPNLMSPYLSRYQPSGQGVQARPFAGAQTRPFAGLYTSIFGGAPPQPKGMGVAGLYHIIIVATTATQRQPAGITTFGGIDSRPKVEVFVL